MRRPRPDPENPYGESKLLVERALPWFESVGIRSVSLRYFNAAGADARRAPRRGLGRRREPGPGGHPCRRWVGRPALRIHGTDYPTPDGTAIRDYVHVDRPGRGAHPGARLPRRRRSLDDPQPRDRRGFVRPRGRARGRERDRRLRPDASSPSAGRAIRPPSGRMPARAEAVLGWRARFGLPDLVGSARALASRAPGRVPELTAWTPPDHHRRLHHVALPEADRDVHPRRARRRRSPGRPHRALPAPPRARPRSMHPEAAAWVERAHYLPFLSLPILRSNVGFLIGHPRRYLGTLAAMFRGTWRSANFFVGGIGIFPKSVHAATEMRRLGVEHVHCHFATHPALAGFLIHRLAGIPYSFTAHGSDLHVDRTMLCQKAAEAAFSVTISRSNQAVFERECGGPVARPRGHPLRDRRRGLPADATAVDGDPRGHLRRDAPRGQGPALPHRRRGGARRAGRRRGRDVHR